jgi:hypothetical protein
VQICCAQAPLQHSLKAWQLEPPGLQLPPLVVLEPVVRDPVLSVPVLLEPVLTDPVVMLEPTLVTVTTPPPPLGSAPPEPVVEPSGLVVDEPQAAPKRPRRARRTGNQAKCFMSTSAWDATCRSTVT